MYYDRRLVGASVPTPKVAKNQKPLINNSPNDGLVISIKEARKILGSKYNGIPDEDLAGIIMSLEGLAIDTLLTINVRQSRKVGI